ncbi:anthranilate synthase component I [Aneurinibacillus thermoaerophilus]|nr:anthranilate synthase component I [Aneurinibacillus thermoaerophilus]MED0674959.1 anthranilate synthase component I [Aneurinibacillus thermoaerophilus]
MIFTPSLSEVLQLSRSFTFIPVSYSFLADKATPIHLYQTLKQKDSFLLESVENESRWARYSFIGLRPFLKLRAGHEGAEFIYRDAKRIRVEGNPLEAFRRQLSRFRSPNLPNMPPFTGGAVGLLGYDTLRFVEMLPKASHDELQLDTLHLLFVDEVIAYDHLKQEVKVIVNMRVKEGMSEADVRAAYEAACGRIRELVSRIAKSETRAFARVDNIPSEGIPLAAVSNMTKQEFMCRVERAKEYIAAGDIFQVVLSQRFAVPHKADPLLVYRILRLTNPSPYMYYFEIDGATIVGTSPELLVKVTDGKVEMRPIAGTRRRGMDEAEDAALVADMLADEKERAEHLMLLDLGRNDVGRVSRYGSVEVTEQMVVEYYSRVMHLVSHVQGTLAEDKEPFDALLSCFPAGTLSGAPKIRAMEIIAELEGEARGFYGGAVGYFGFGGNLDSCIVIRTILFKDGMAYVQAGAGIVADSIPENEYEETRNKVRAMLHALSLAEKMTSVEEMSAHV